MHSLKKGFSLIELLVVIAIIGILAAVGTTGYQVYIDSTKLAVVKNNAATLLQAASTEDMAQSAGVGGYAQCNNKDNLGECVQNILTASTLSNPYRQNDTYTMAGDTTFATTESAVLVCGAAADLNGVTCTEGSLGLAINNLDEDRPLLRSYFCKDNTLTLQDQAGSKPMAYFESSPECDLRVDNEVIEEEEIIPSITIDPERDSSGQELLLQQFRDNGSVALFVGETSQNYALRTSALAIQVGVIQNIEKTYALSYNTDGASPELFRIFKEYINSGLIKGVNFLSTDYIDPDGPETIAFDNLNAPSIIGDDGLPVMIPTYRESLGDMSDEELIDYLSRIMAL